MSTFSKVSDLHNASLTVDPAGSKRQRTGSIDGHTYEVIPTAEQSFLFSELPELIRIGVLKKLDLPDILNARLVSSSLNADATDHQVWQLNASLIDCPLNAIDPVFNQVQTFIRELRKTAMDIKDRPKEITKLLQTKVPTIADINTIQKWLKALKARDTLIVWGKIAEYARLPVPDFPDTNNIEATIAKAEEFPVWCEANEEIIANAPFDLAGENPIPDWDLDEQNSSLDLSDHQLHFLPEEIHYLSRLKHLDLSTNKLSKLPASLSKLSQLDCLVINENHFSSVPEVVRGLTQLDALCVENNQITSLPEWIFTSFKDLSYFYFSGNPLIELPEGILKLFKILADVCIEHNEEDYFLSWLDLAKRLNCLNETAYDSIPRQIDSFVNNLSIQINEIENLPNEIKKALESFTVAEINYLQSWLKARDTLVFWEAISKQLPHSISPRLENLTRSEEFFTKAAEFPAWCAANQEGLAQLSSLDLNNKNLTSLPKEIGCLTNLQELNLEDNTLKALPNEFKALLQLRRLNLNRNWLDSIPSEILNLTKLQELHLSGTLNFGIRFLPIHLCALTELRILDLSSSYFKLSELPEKLHQFLKKLKRPDGTDSLALGSACQRDDF